MAQEAVFILTSKSSERILRVGGTSSWPVDHAHNGLVGGSNPPGPTTQSCATGDFLKVYERPRIGGDPCDGSFSETASLQSAGRFGRFPAARSVLPALARTPAPELA